MKIPYSFVFGTVALLLGGTGKVSAQLSPSAVQPYSNFPGREAINAINGSGLIDLGGGQFGHTDDPTGNMWLTNFGETTGAITFDLGANYAVDTLRVWNYNESIGGTRPDLLNRGVATGTISVASDAAGPYTPVLNNASFNIAPGTINADFSQSFSLGGSTARFVRIDVLANHVDSFTGLSEVQFNGTFLSGVVTSALPVSSVVASSALGGFFNRLPEFTIDRSGLRGSFDDTIHSILPDGSMWLSGQNDTMPTITWDLGSVLPLSHMNVWNYNEQTAGLTTRGINETDISISNNGLDFTPLANRNFAQAPGSQYVDFGERVDLNASARYVRFAVQSNHGDASFTGLSEVEFFAVPEPSAFLLGLAACGLLAARRRPRP